MFNIKKLFKKSVRRYIYLVFVALIPVAVYFGVIPPEASVVILPLILALLNLTPDEEVTAKHAR